MLEERSMMAGFEEKRQERKAQSESVRRSGVGFWWRPTRRDQRSCQLRLQRCLTTKRFTSKWSGGGLFEIREVVVGDNAAARGPR